MKINDKEDLIITSLIIFFIVLCFSLIGIIVTKGINQTKEETPTKNDISDISRCRNANGIPIMLRNKITNCLILPN